MGGGLGARFERLERFRIGPFREGAFTSRLHSERIATWLGLALGISFGILFVTGLVSHAIQDPPGWFLWPSRPVNLYRVTQGLHVAAGIASVPLLLAKLWTVIPRLYTWPPVEDIAHLVERISLLPLVGGSVFMLVTGLMNVGLFEPWGFFFPAAHFWGAWITIGALVVHIGAKARVTRRALSRAAGSTPELVGNGMSRRGFLGAVGAAAAILTLTSLGQTVRPLSRIGLFAPRRPDFGPQGLPVNKTATSAGVLDSARDPAYRLSVEGNVPRPYTLTLEELRAMPQHEASLPIACVQGWSADANWRGVRVADLLDRAGAGPDAEVGVESLQRAGRFRASEMNRLHARDDLTLLALEVNGEPLHIEHGYPARLIGPNRPGVMQTKWVNKLVVR